MGCSGGKPKQDPIPKLRRGLTLGNVESSGEAAPEEVSEEDRAMLVQLTDQDVLDYIEADKNAGRKFSIGSETDERDPAKMASFANKTIRLQGTPYEVEKTGIGYACKKGLKPEAPNQDSFLILQVGEHCRLYGVFDGHGRKGHDVSNFIKDNFPKILFSQENYMTDPASAMQKTFHKTQYLIEKATRLGRFDANRSGSTASVALHDVKNNLLHVAHVGDSRVVLAQEMSKDENGNCGIKTLDLSVDHKPDQPEERKRIEKAGGIVVFDGAWNHRVYAKKKDKTGRSYPGLNMSRAMGDLQGYHDAGISATPDISSRKILDGTQVSGEDSSGISDKFILLCSDGVWEFVSSSTAVQIVNSFPFGEAQKAAEQLAAIAWDHWVDEMNGEVVDDITALVVHLKGRDPPEQTTTNGKATDSENPQTPPKRNSVNSNGSYPLPPPDNEEPLMDTPSHQAAWRASCGGWHSENAQNARA
jgi:serine/threonine protein phosphatase PrpC